MWSRQCAGLTLTFHLAGINNQNFLMRDEETGTYWQQVTGLAIAGPLAGRRLAPVPSDELSFAIWRSEQPAGTVLDDVPAYRSDYAPRNWDVEMAKTPTVLSFAQPGLQPRTVVLGLEGFGASRAFVFDRVRRERLVQDRLGGEPVLLLLGSDNLSVRAFRRRLPSGQPAQFYRLPDPRSPILDDAGNGWDFQGCAVTGPAKGACLERLQLTKDYWFDWRNYHPETTVYR